MSSEHESSPDDVETPPTSGEEDVAATEETDRASGDEEAAAPEEPEHTTGDEDVAATEEPERAGGPSASERLIRAALSVWRPVVAASLVIAAIAAAVGVYFFQYRPAQQTDDAAQRQVVQAASDGVVAAVSYSYDHLDRDIARAKSLSSGEFLAYYTKFSEEFIAPAAKKGQLTAKAKVLRAAISEMHPDSAVVLVFINQDTASKEKPEPLTTASSVLVTMAKVEGSWLISKLYPL
jgi:Mce-associated membrane protein